MTNVQYLSHLISTIKDVSAAGYSFTKKEVKKVIIFFQAIQSYHALG